MPRDSEVAMFDGLNRYTLRKVHVADWGLKGAWLLIRIWRKMFAPFMWA